MSLDSVKREEKESGAYVSRTLTKSAGHSAAELSLERIERTMSSGKESNKSGFQTFSDESLDLFRAGVGSPAAAQECFLVLSGLMFSLG